MLEQGAEAGQPDGLVLRVGRCCAFAFNGFDQEEEGGRNDGEADDPDPGRDAREFWERDFAAGTKVADELSDEWEGFGVDASTDDGARDPDDGVLGALADGCEGGAWAIAKQDHANAEDSAADGVHGHGDGLDVERLDDAGVLHGVDTDGPNEDGGEHGFEDGEVFEEKLRDDDVVACDAAALEQKSEDQACDCTEEQGGWGGKEVGVHGEYP